MIRIAFINNVSSAAFTAVPPPFPVKWQDGSPRDTYEALSAGHCDAGLLSAARLPELEPWVEALGAYGIAARGAVRSVIFFGRRSLSEIVRRDEPVYLERESQTASALFRILCVREFKAVPRLCPSPERASGVLRIGNHALDVSLAAHGWPFQLDLGQWWFDATGRPFVFARWVARRGLPAAERRELMQWLNKTVAVSCTPDGRHAMAARHPGVFPDGEAANRYFDGLHHRLTPEDLAALEAFLQMKMRHLPAHGAKGGLPCEQSA